MKLAKYSGTALEGMLSRLVRPLGLRQVLGPSLGFLGGGAVPAWLHGFLGLQVLKIHGFATVLHEWP